MSSSAGLSGVIVCPADENGQEKIGGQQQIVRWIHHKNEDLPLLAVSLYRNKTEKRGVFVTAMTNK